MGQALSDIFNGVSGEVAKKALNSLAELTLTRYNALMIFVKARPRTKDLLPIRSIFALLPRVIKCNVQLDGAAIGKIGGLIKDYASGAILQGITDLSINTLGLMFRNFDANQSQVRAYFITVGSDSKLMRLDVDCCAYEFTSADLGAICKNVVASSVVVSAIDTTEIDRNSLRFIVHSVNGRLPSEREANINNEVLNALEHDQDSLHYKRLNGLAPPYQ